MACGATGTGLNISVRPGAGVVERNTLVGSYVVAAYQTGQVTLAAANATNPRIDRVDLQVLDGALGDNGGTSLTQYVVTTGVASGTPAVPAAPTNSIPLCQVLLPANTTTLTGGMFTDKRRSAGLRGAARFLLPGDALSDPGFVIGEKRARLVANYTGTPISTDYWGSDGKWHGMTPLPIAPGQIVQNSSSWVVNTETPVWTITIPDPGWPYYVNLTASAFRQNISGGGYAQLFCRLGSGISGTQMRENTEGTNGFFGFTCELTGEIWNGALGTPFTGTQTLSVTGATGQTGSLAMQSQWCSATVMPV